MPKTLEQIMEEQMMAMMSQMMASSQSQQSSSSSSYEDLDFEDNSEDDNFDEDFDDNYYETDRYESSESDSFTGDSENFEQPSSFEDVDFYDGSEFGDFNFDKDESTCDPINTEPEQQSESPESSGTAEKSKYDFFYAGSNAEEAPLKGSKTVKFAFDNYNNIGIFTSDKDLFYSITERGNFARAFSKKVGDSVEDSNLLPLLISFANEVVANGFSASSSSTSSGSAFSQSDIVPTPEDMSSNPSYDELLMQNKILNDFIKRMSGQILKEREFFKRGMSEEERKVINDDVMNKTQPFEKLTMDKCSASFFSNSFEYMCYNQKKSYDIRFSEDSDVTSISNNMLKLSECILNDIYTMVGGAGRITDLMVVSGLIIVNGVSYEPILPESYMKYIPIADRTAVMSGYFANFINYKCLRDMKNLTNLSFDTKDFVYSTVRKHLGYGSAFEPKDLFAVCKSLMNLQIGEIQITRATRNDFDDLFHIQRRSSQIADWCTQQLDDGFSLGVNSIKDFWSSRAERGILGNVWGFTWRGTATAAVGIGDASLRFGRGALKFAGNIKTGVNAVIEAVKQDL